jgi:hypothetical protein
VSYESASGDLRGSRDKRHALAVVCKEIIASG